MQNLQIDADIKKEICKNLCNLWLKKISRRFCRFKQIDADISKKIFKSVSKKIREN